MAWTTKVLNASGESGTMVPDSQQNPNWRVRNTAAAQAAFQYQQDNSPAWTSVPLGNLATHTGHADLQVAIKRTAGAIAVEFFD